VVLNRNNDILVSFADDTPPSYAAIFALLLDQIDNTNLLICEDYETDEDGSMVCNKGPADYCRLALVNGYSGYKTACASTLIDSFHLLSFLTGPVKISRRENHSSPRTNVFSP
jgi:hypothetical protein